jgi:hypothetical protein
VSASEVSTNEHYGQRVSVSRITVASAGDRVGEFLMRPRRARRPTSRAASTVAAVRVVAAQALGSSDGARGWVGKIKVFMDDTV